MHRDYTAIGGAGLYVIVSFFFGVYSRGLAVWLLADWGLHCGLVGKWMDKVW